MAQWLGYSISAIGAVFDPYTEKICVWPTGNVPSLDVCMVHVCFENVNNNNDPKIHYIQNKRGATFKKK